MQLRTLTLQAIGPFVGRHTIDFAELGAGGLFLLEGPTGAGKSTLIDAVVFALYGKVASEQASDERLRSTAAGPDTESFVDLVFEVPAGVFRVRRTPQFERTKLRGDGTTTQNATVRVWRNLPGDTPTGAGPGELDGYGEPLTTRPDEAGQVIARAVGLDRAQFVQTVVLPQGEFAAFLRARPEDRRVLLQRIFGTQVYDALTARLVDLRKAANAAVEAARGALGEALSHFAGAARLSADEAEALRDEVDGVVKAAEPADAVAAGVAAVVTGRTARLAAAAGAATAAATAADADRARARAALDEATAAAALLARRDALRAEHTRLEGAAADADERRARLARARDAATVRPLLVGADAAATALEAASAALTAALGAAPEGLVPASEPDDGLREHLDGARRTAAATAATLDRLVAVEAGLPAREAQVAAQAAEAQRLSARVAEGAAWLAARPAQRAALVGQLDEARATAGGLAAQAAEARSARERLAAHDRLALATAEYAAAESARAEAVAGVGSAVETERQLRLARVAGLAGELAGALVVGEPCPVCGSTDHPAPAVLAPDHVSPEAVEAAEHARAEAEDRLRVAARRIGRAAGELGALTAQVGDGDRSVADAALAAAQEAVAACRSAAAQATELASALEGFDAATAQRQEAHGGDVAALARLEADLDTARRTVADATAEVAAARDGHPTVAARHAALTARVRAAEGLLAAIAGRDRAADSLAERAVERDAGAAAAGFRSADEARAALLPPDELARLDSEVAAYAADVARVAAGLAEEAVAALPDELVVDVAGATAAEREAREAAEAAAGAALVAVDAAKAADASGAAVVERTRVLAASSSDAVPVVRLANLVGGGADARGLTLGTFVLMRRFEDVVAAANQRLLVMSDGRYSLVRSDEKEDVRARSTGLAMRVVDHLTETPRDPRTLSGGETFYVSLCLALGLADVVTAEAGGIDLGTLFVDEGFGSLDPHVLDQVLAELGRLRAGGRVVGVVSHVEALKQAIADRIEVRPCSDGTSTLVVRAG